MKLKLWEWPLVFPIMSTGIVSIAASPLAFIYGGHTIDTLFMTYDIISGLGVSFAAPLYYIDERSKINKKINKIIDRRGLRLRKQILQIEPDGEFVTVESRRKLSNGEVKIISKSFHAENEQEQAYEFIGKLREKVAEPSSTLEALALAKSLKDFKR